MTVRINVALGEVFEFVRSKVAERATAPGWVVKVLALTILAVVAR